MTRLFLMLVLGLSLVFGFASDRLAKKGSHGVSEGGGKGGHYSGGKGQVTKAGQYSPPYGSDTKVKLSSTRVADSLPRP